MERDAGRAHQIATYRVEMRMLDDEAKLARNVPMLRIEVSSAGAGVPDGGLKQYHHRSEVRSAFAALGEEMRAEMRILKSDLITLMAVLSVAHVLMTVASFALFWRWFQ